MYLLSAVGILQAEKHGKSIARSSEASIPTRYPEDLARVQQVFTEGVVRDILVGGGGHRMEKSTVVDLVTRLRRGVKARGIRPQKIILYGSFVDGTHREGSHIDLVIVSDDFAGKNYWERIDILADAIYLRSTPSIRCPCPIPLGTRPRTTHAPRVEIPPARTTCHTWQRPGYFQPESAQTNRRKSMVAHPKVGEFRVPPRLTLPTD
jgi:hypothetical protein